MSIKGNGQTLYIGKEKITIEEFLERDKIFYYDEIKSIEYQFADNANFGFMRFKLNDGDIHTFIFGKKSNEPMSRAVSFISQKYDTEILKECSEKMGRNERFALYSTRKKILPFVTCFGLVFAFMWVVLDGGNIFGNKITLEKYNQCQIGMTYEECVKIIGEEGEPMVETDIADTNASAYLWYGYDIGSNANLYFMNGKLYSKGQFGLK